jgi:enamine deaminase RidA (YjgF/YER057c/UK114 family)
VPLSPVVRAGDFVFVFSMPPLDPATGELVLGDVEVQTERVLENVKLALETAGTLLEKVVKVNVYAPNAAWFRRINAVYARYFPAAPSPHRVHREPMPAPLGKAPTQVEQGRDQDQGPRVAVSPIPRRGRGAEFGA